MLTRYQLKFYYGFIFCTLLVFSPFKALAYFSSFALLLFFLFRRFPLLDKHFLKCLTFFLGGLFLLHFFYSSLYEKAFDSQSFFLSALTYSSFYPLFFIRSTELNNPLLFNKIATFSIGIFFIQGLIGIIQSIYGFVKTGSFDVANGDHVEGTIHLPLPSELTFANPMFSCNMICLLVIILIYYINFSSLKRLFLIIPGILAIVLGSVMHQILIFIVAICIAIFVLPNSELINVKTRNLKKKLVWAIIIGTLPVLLILSQNLSGIIAIPAAILTKEGIPKAIVTKHALIDVPKEYPIMPYVGLGPGQFSSRAALLSSGLFLGGPSNPRAMPLLGISTNPIAAKYVHEVFIEFSDTRYFGSSQKPFYSILSLFSEFGFIGFFIILIAFFRYLLSLRKKLKISQVDGANAYGMGIFSLSLFILGLGVQVNYYEVVQAIFLGILIIKLCHAQLLSNGVNK